MYSEAIIADVLALREEGLSASVIACRTGIPRSTVRLWLAGRLPHSCGPTCRDCGGGVHDFAGMPDAYAYLLGAYLGDGCISRHPRDVLKLRITLDAAYPGIIAEVREAITAIGTARVGQWARSDNAVEVYSYARNWGCLFPQHGAGKKHDRPIYLASWQDVIVDRRPDLLLRGLIHSDGCRFINTGTNWSNPRYTFSNRSQDIRRIFCDACDCLGLRWTQAPHTIYVSRKADVARMDEFVGPKT